MKYALIGHSLAHTLSPYIHERLFEKSGVTAEYSALDCASLDGLTALASGLDGYNVTIPYKTEIIKYLDGLKGEAQSYKSVNCVKIKDGKSIGFNTDAYGFLKSTEILGGIPESVLLLGFGGVGRTFAAICADKKLTVAVRNPTSQKEKDISDALAPFSKNANVVDINAIPRKKYGLLINATPAGMYPRPDASPVGSEVVAQADAVFDAIYNPEKTLLLKYAKQLKIPALGGMEMLVYQACKAHEIWYGAKFDDAFARALADDCRARVRKEFSQRLFITGFMGSGKSFFAREISELTGLPLFDTDKIIEEKYGAVETIFKTRGEAYFRGLEREILLSLPEIPSVISTGGGTLADAANADYVRARGSVLFIDAPLELCLSRIEGDPSRPLAGDAQRLYRQRRPIYLSVADAVESEPKKILLTALKLLKIG